MIASSIGFYLILGLGFPIYSSNRTRYIAWTRDTCVSRRYLKSSRRRSFGYSVSSFLSIRFLCFFNPSSHHTFTKGKRRKKWNPDFMWKHVRFVSLVLFGLTTVRWGHLRLVNWNGRKLVAYVIHCLKAANCFPSYKWHLFSNWNVCVVSLDGRCNYKKAFQTISLDSQTFLIWLMYSKLYATICLSKRITNFKISYDDMTCSANRGHARSKIMTT